MQEELLHYLWKYGLYATNSLKTVNSQKVTVISPGQLNHEAGPDFLFARILISGVTWVGDVELHLRSSDWYRHHHETNPAYSAVILHVVAKYDQPVFRIDGKELPALILPVNPRYEENYRRIQSRPDLIPCAATIPYWPGLMLENLISRMGVERMEYKNAEINRLLHNNRGGWQETLMQLFFRAFGFGVNQDNFEQLSRQIPWKVLQRCQSNLFRLEALLFGQAGLIPGRPDRDPYIKALRYEYHFLKKKYNLPIPTPVLWKFLRMRPANFPTVRLAQLATILHFNDGLMELALTRNGQFPIDCIHYYPSLYWRQHYHFNRLVSGTYKLPGKGTYTGLMINATLPFRACYAHAHDDPASRDTWMEILYHLPPEDNRISRLWLKSGVILNSAWQTQALFHLFRFYCREKRCLACPAGHYLIRYGK